MKVLIITQTVDQKDPVLGFVHQWIHKLSLEFEVVHVISLFVGEYDLPQNVFVHSLGKESKRSRIQYIRRFLYYVWILRKEYDGVFVHMNQEYVLIGWWMWKLLRKKVVFWYNHTVGTFKTDLAMMFSNVVCHTSPFAYTANSSKSRRMPAGIDVSVFSPKNIERNRKTILFVARLSPSKGLHVVINSMEELSTRGFKLSIVGVAPEGCEKYQQFLNDEVKKNNLEDVVTFLGSLSQEELPFLYSSHEFFVNCADRGNYDKTVLEAMACGSLPVVSSDAFDDILVDVLTFKKDDSKGLADSIVFIESLENTQKENYRKMHIKYVFENHRLQKLSKKLVACFNNF